jgi:hypothetical protein
MSGFTPSPERLDALRDTGIVFVAKPFSVDKLLAAIHGQAGAARPD